MECCTYRYFQPNKNAYSELDEQLKITKLIHDVNSLTTSVEGMIETKTACYLKKNAKIITQTVTKGLNVDVPMKDSGIDWFNQIPEHWEKIEN